MDISTSKHTASDIFRLILDKGPLTLYSASTESKFPLGTIHRHFKEMEQSGKITVYRKKQGRKKKPYGPTVYGFVFFYGFDKVIRSKLENYFLLWLDHEEFVTNLKKEGFNVSKIATQPHKSKSLFRKYVHYFSGVEHQLELIKNGQKTIPREISLFIGEALLAMNPEYMKIWEELYKNVPGIKNNVDGYLEDTIKIYKQLKKKHSH